MNKLKKQSRDQLQMICLDSLVEKNSMARVIDSFVDSSDLMQLGFTHYTNKQGRPSYPTDVMVKLYLYGYMNGIRTTRKLEKACKVNLELKWLLCGLTPGYRTIGNFRIQNLEAFNNLFLKTIDLALKHKLIGGKTLAFDSFPIRASNSRKNNYNKKKLEFLSDHAQSQLDKYIDELENNDNHDDEDATKINDKIEHYSNKLEKYKKIDNQLEKENITQISSTDPDARIMSKNDRSNIVGYRTQCGADALHKIVCSTEISQNLKNVIKKYCTNYIQEIYSESDLIEAISMFYANCDLKIFDKMNKAASKGFYSLLEYSEMDKTQLYTWKSQMLRDCKTLIVSLDE